MTYLRIIDQIGNKQDIETDLIPRIGERLMMEFGVGGRPITAHYFRVKDVEYRFDNPKENRVGILVEEEMDPEYWPS
jgi:hypothetical protein